MLKTKKEINNWMNEIEVTQHFIERYVERIDTSLSKVKLDSSTIKDFMNDKMNDREKRTIQFFKNASNVKLPFNQHQIVLKNKTFITIY